MVKTQVFMRCESDCEIPAVANALGLSYEEVASQHDEINGDRRDDLNGSPLHIQVLLKKLGKGFQVVTDDDILSGNIDISKVILLVHSLESPLLNQHWCNVLSVSPTHVVLLWNVPGKAMKQVTHELFRSYYRGGFPNCAYVATDFPEELPWYTRLWVWITGFFA